ncbi:MAG: DUF4124 domain-containing protein [Pseudoxanthomonas sp.]
MRAMILLFMFMLLLAPTGNAQQIYKCVNGGNVSYQSAVCDANWKIARQWEAVPEAESSATDLRQRQLEDRRQRAGSAQLSRAAGTGRARSTSHRRDSPGRKPGTSPCDASKARREAKLKSVGLKRTFDLLRRLDDAVNEACK